MAVNALSIDAAEIRIRAERRLDAMLREQKETVGMAKGGQPYQSTPSTKEGVETPTLANIGVDYKLSMRSQKVADIPEEIFEGMMGEWRERITLENERVIVNLLKENARCPNIAANVEYRWYPEDEFPHRKPD